MMFTQVIISILEITSRYWRGSQFRIDVIPRLTKFLLYESHRNIIWIRGNLQKYEERNNKWTLRVVKQCGWVQVSKVYSAGMDPQWNRNRREKNNFYGASWALCYQKNWVSTSSPLHTKSCYKVQFILANQVNTLELHLCYFTPLQWLQETAIKTHPPY